MLQTYGVLETSLYVSDIERADKFYSEVLRLPRVRKQIERELAYRCGDCILIFFRAEATRTQTHLPPHAAEGTGHLAFRIRREDIASWRSHLASCGVPIEQEIPWPRGGHSIYFRDPDGNCIELATVTVWPVSLAHLIKAEAESNTLHLSY